MSHTQMPPGMASMGQRTPNLSYRATHMHTHAPIQQPIPHHIGMDLSSTSSLGAPNCNIKISVAGASGAIGNEELQAPKVTLLDDLSDEVNSSTDDCGECCLVQDDSDTYEASNNNGNCTNQDMDEPEAESAGAEDSGDSSNGIYIGSTH